MPKAALVIAVFNQLIFEYENTGVFCTNARLINTYSFQSTVLSRTVSLPARDRANQIASLLMMCINVAIGNSC